MPGRAGLLIVLMIVLGAPALLVLPVGSPSLFHPYNGLDDPPSNHAPGGQVVPTFSAPFGLQFAPANTISNPANLLLVMAADRSSARSGDVLTYTLWFNNTGGGSTEAAWINDSLPSGMSYLSDNASGIGGVRTGNYNWSFTHLPPGTHYFLLHASLDGGLAPGSVLTNRASLNYTDLTGALRPGSRVAVGIVVSPTEGTIPWVPLALALVVGLPILFLLLRPRGRIQEIFLVNYDGTLMAHLSRTITPDKDRDVLTGMLTAIQDFIRDAFVRSPGEELRDLRFGQQRIQIQRGAYSYLAVVSRGRTPWGLPGRMKETLARIEGKFGGVMANWRGNPGDLAAASEILSEGLLERPRLGILHPHMRA